MIRITDSGKNGVKIVFPGSLRGKIPQKTVYYYAEDDGVLFKCSGVERKILCKRYMIRQIILFDLLFIKAKQYNYTVKHILYNGKSLLKTTFPSMNIELTAEEYTKERKLLSDLSEGKIFTAKVIDSDLEILLDLFVTGGIK